MTTKTKPKRGAWTYTNPSQSYKRHVHVWSARGWNTGHTMLYAKCVAVDPRNCIMPMTTLTIDQYGQLASLGMISEPGACWW